MVDLILNDDLLLGKGTERYCYQHPQHSNKVIKILRELPKKNKSNALESLYYSHLEKKNISQEQIALCFGYVVTNLGEGLVFERVLNADDSPAKPFDQLIKDREISTALQRRLISKLLDYLEKNQILFVDMGLSNLFCKKQANGEYILVIVDGLGARKLDYRYWLYIGIGWYRRKKIRKQAKKMLRLFPER